MPSMSVKGSKSRRHSMPPASQPTMMWPPMMPAPMGPMYPWMYGQSSAAASTAACAGPSAASSSQSSRGKRPWADSMAPPTSSTEDSDSDFELPKSKKKATKKTSALSLTLAAGKGRPSTTRKREMEKIVAAYPKEILAVDQIAHDQSKECPACRIYVGQVAEMPCGHAKFCFSCINTAREKAVETRRPFQCLKEECKLLVQKWVQLYHVMA